jgi:hypothetical protein
VHAAAQDLLRLPGVGIGQLGKREGGLHLGFVRLLRGNFVARPRPSSRGPGTDVISVGAGAITSPVRQIWRRPVRPRHIWRCPQALTSAAPPTSACSRWVEESDRPSAPGARTTKPLRAPKHLILCRIMIAWVRSVRRPIRRSLPTSAPAFQADRSEALPRRPFFTDHAGAAPARRPICASRETLNH